jgi:hypothetical protein
MEWMETERIGIIVVIRTIAIVSAISNEVFFIRLMSRIFFINIYVQKRKGNYLNLSVLRLLLICLGTFRKSLQRAITKTKGISGNDYPGTSLWSAA